MFESIKRKNRGITLVSLVITIIILIILAGVSINLIIGTDGIITRAKEAKENMEIATIEEQEKLNELYEKLDVDNISDGSLNDAIAKLVDFKNKIAIAITESGIETSGSDSAETMSNNIKKLGQEGNTEEIRQKLYNSLKYSGHVTEDMTIDEICTTLANVYPYGYEHVYTLKTGGTDASIVYAKYKENTLTQTVTHMYASNSSGDYENIQVAYDNIALKWKVTAKTDIYYWTNDADSKKILSKGTTIAWGYSEKIDYKFGIGE